MKKVLLIDSGSGGVNVLLECIKIAPYCDFLMFCDNANLPYGNRSKSELVSITLNNLKNIQNFFDFDIVILACNTLTSTVIEECRNEFEGVVFIGVVPAIKTALKEFESKDILVLATKATIENNALIKENSGLQLKAMDTLASDIDKNLDNVSVLEKSLEMDLQGVSAKAIVLGCTHYVAVRDILQKIFPLAKIYSSEEGVAKRLKSFLDEGQTKYQVQFITSKNDQFLPKIIWYFNKKNEK